MSASDQRTERYPWDYFVESKPVYVERAERLLAELGLCERTEGFQVEVRVTPRGGSRMEQTQPSVSMMNVLDARMGLEGMRYVAERMLDRIVDAITKRGGSDV